MIPIQAIATTSLWQPTNLRASAESPTLMPEPQCPDTVGSDAMAALYALMSKQRNNDSAAGESSVTHNREFEKAQEVKQQDELKKQEDAQQNAAQWGIFGKIASVVAIAVSAVASVCSCGAASGLCAAACVLSTIAFAEGEAHVITTLTNNPDAEKAFQFVCGIGAAACSGGAGIASLGANAFSGAMQIASAACKVTQESVSTFATGKDAQYVAMAFSIGSAVTSLGGGIASASGFGNAAESVADGAKTASTTAQVVTGTMSTVNDFVKGGSEIMAGVSAIGVGMYQADASDRATDAKEAQMSIKHLQQLTEWVIDGLKDTDASHKRALQTLQGAMQTQAQTLVIATTRV